MTPNSTKKVHICMDNVLLILSIVVNHRSVMYHHNHRKLSWNNSTSLRASLRNVLWLISQIFACIALWLTVRNMLQNWDIGICVYIHLKNILHIRLSIQLMSASLHITNSFIRINCPGFFFKNYQFKNVSMFQTMFIFSWRHVPQVLHHTFISDKPYNSTRRSWSNNVY